MKRLVIILMLIASPLWAVEPDEILADPVLEERARELSKGLRCLVCKNESIDESHATLARDLRILLRERLVAGDSDEAAIEFIVERYGEFVLLQPRATGSTLLLWAAGPLMLLLAGGMGFMYLRGRATAPTRDDDVLSDAEKTRLDQILGADFKE
jgi:cytochrome c-type biogenesis protein CcmH